MVEAAVGTALENYMASLLFIMREHLVPACRAFMLSGCCENGKWQSLSGVINTIHSAG